MNLPEDMIYLVLCRLPVKSLLGFKCVSKQFCSMIDSENFIQFHLRYSVENNTEPSLVIQDKKKICSVNVVDSPTWQTRELDAPFGCSRTKILGSCNGLICVLKSAICSEPNLSALYRTLPRMYNILPKIAFWNPSTSNKFHVLPIDPIEVRGLNYSGFVDVQHAFGHDSVNNDYKVLRIVKLYNELDSFIIKVRVYSLKTNSWREIIAPSQANEIMTVNRYVRRYVLVREAFHWLIKAHEPNICAFDIQGEEFCTVPLPNFGVPQGCFNMNLGVLGQCLCLASTRGRENIVMWMMKEYGRKDSWVKLFSLPRDSPAGYVLYTVPLAAYSKDVHDLDHEKVLLKLVTQYGEKLVRSDRKNKKSVVKILGLQRETQLFTYVGSLVSPFSNDGSKTKNKKKRRRDENA
ncbi:unnamed protein product [Dovyalis caffra]|uniref:F-box domain-containing protein n=1 Tax=Dovyalis caffra TaxID=77055 RepID=A0AAV1RNI4_9ROSI|nr:unnamed protein product [Dovyalis caffra]